MTTEKGGGTIAQRDGSIDKRKSGRSNTGLMELEGGHARRDEHRPLTWEPMAGRMPTRHTNRRCNISKHQDRSKSHGPARRIASWHQKGWRQDKRRRNDKHKRRRRCREWRRYESRAPRATTQTRLAPWSDFDPQSTQLVS